MIFKELTEREYKAIYSVYMMADFPQSELKPRKRLLKLREDGIYSGYGLYNEEGLAAYAILGKRTESNVYLLDYLAVSGKRNEGLGSAMLRALAKTLEDADGILIEIEAPDCAVFEQELNIRHRRKAFYVQNGFDPTTYRSRQFTSVLDIMVLPLADKNFTDEKAYQELQRLYEVTYKKELRRGKVDIYVHEIES